MKQRILVLSLACFLLTAGAVSAQVVVVNDPTKASPVMKLTAAEKRIFERDALPAVRKMIGSEVCEESRGEAGVVRGAFTAAGKRQSLIFYEYCQTGNGFGWNGLVLIEGDKVVGNFVSEGGWGVDIGSVPDLNGNGISEFTLAYTGGMHQGIGGIGVDLMEFTDGLPKGLGWYKAEEFGPTGTTNSWKLTAKPGKTPVFYKQKYSGEGKKARPIGRNAVTKLGTVFVSKFETVK